MSKDTALISAACEARQHAFVPYSQYRVGAAVRTAQGHIFRGCNVENKSYSLTICAERAAVFNAIQAGEQDFEALAIATEDGAAPCGACRQVLAEFAPDLSILLVTAQSPPTFTETNLKLLLPDRF
jgi:cytidine deaminase